MNSAFSLVSVGCI